MSELTPVDNLFRGVADGIDLRAETDVDGSTMYGHFTPFDTWSEIDSWFEGRFLERTVKGAFRKTIRENRDQVKVQFDHGFDFNVGDALLGPIDVLREEDEGPYYEVPLLDTDYNRDRILPMLQGRLMSGEQRGSVLGASYRFRVVKEEWVRTPKASDHNPEALPERTIREVRLFEFGPVVYPAFPTATAKVRSLTDHFLERQRDLRSAQRPHLLVSAGDPATVTDPDEPAPMPLDVIPVRSVSAARLEIVKLTGARS
jgi:HK97 family phage prohead protease